MRTFNVSYGANDGFKVSLNESNPFWYHLEAVMGAVCEKTNGRFCHLIHGPVATKLWRSEKTIHELPITAIEADKLDLNRGSWGWLMELELKAEK